MNTITSCRAQQLRAVYETFHEKNPKVRIRTAAHAMGVSEMELVASCVGTLQSTRLKSPVQDIFKELGSLGRVMALSRNDWAVHERHGTYEEIRAGKTMGIVLGPDIDLRLFFKHWSTAWAVNDNGRQSIQFFDTGGTAVHKVFCTDETDKSAYAAMVKKFTDDQAQWPALKPVVSENDALAPAAPPELRSRWKAMTDTHQFHSILQDLNISRLTALRGAGTDLAQKIDNSIVEQMLEAVVEQQIPFMCFVGNAGIVQIHSGAIERVMRTGPWFNVLDPLFNLHLDTTAITQTWLVNRPTSDGWITSLECFAANGELITQFFGARKPGIPELSAWRQLLSAYATEALAS